MRYQDLGPLGPVSRICLGGGGIGGVWGAVTQGDAVETLRHAVDSGVTLLDTSPGYGFCESVIAQAFEGRLDPAVFVTTKIWLDPASPESVFEASRRVVHASTQAMRVERIDILFLHNGLIRDEAERENRPSGPVLYPRYVDEVAPAMVRLQEEGHIRSWGITAGSGSRAALDALENRPQPAVAQIPTNLLDSGGDMSPLKPEASHRVVVARAAELGVGVMGIRVLQAGALASAIDRPVGAGEPTARDHLRAAPFFEFCREIGEDAVEMAYRYALGMPGVATLVAGAKTKEEFDLLLSAERQGPLSAAEMEAIERMVSV